MRNRIAGLRHNGSGGAALRTGVRDTPSRSTSASSATRSPGASLPLTISSTSVTIAPIGAPAVWDFLIDSVAFNQSIGSIINPPPAPVDQPPTPHVHGHRHGHGHGEGEIEWLGVNFGDDINDIRGSVIVITPVPEPATWVSMLLGLWAICLSTLLRRRSIR